MWHCGWEEAVAVRGGSFEGAGVEPLEEPFEDLWFFFRETDSLVEAFGESAVEGRGEEGRGGGQEVFVDDVFGFRAGFVVWFAYEDGRHVGHRAEAHSEWDAGWCASNTVAAQWHRFGEVWLRNGRGVGRCW